MRSCQSRQDQSVFTPGRNRWVRDRVRNSFWARSHKDSKTRRNSRIKDRGPCCPRFQRAVQSVAIEQLVKDLFQCKLVVCHWFYPYEFFRENCDCWSRPLAGRVHGTHQFRFVLPFL
jgi:hypothetical protein